MSITTANAAAARIGAKYQAGMLVAAAKIVGVTTVNDEGGLVFPSSQADGKLLAQDCSLLLQELLRQGRNRPI